MDIPPLLIQFLISLVAILALAGVAVWLGLGGKVALNTDQDIAASAAEAMDGFEATQFAKDTHGKAALARDNNGRIMLLKAHGNHIAARMLDGNASANANENTITIATGDYWYGSAEMQCEQPQIWADAINALKAVRDA